MSITITQLQMFELHLGAAVRTILADAGLTDALAAGTHSHHIGDFVGIRLTLPDAGGALIDSTGRSWQLRFNNAALDIEISQRRAVESSAALDAVHKHFWELAGIVRNALQPWRIEEHEIFNDHDLPTIPITYDLEEGPEPTPIYAVGAIAPRSTLITYNDAFDEDVITLTYTLSFGVRESVLNAVLAAS